MSSSPAASALARLAAADPARGLSVDAHARDELWQRLLAGEGERSPLHPDHEYRQRLRARTVLVLVVLVLAALGALAAGGVIEIGSPAKLPFSALRDGAGENAVLLPGSVHKLPIEAPDPAGGPPWGMRELATSGGEGCLQFGRIVDGKLGALGQDHAFGDDGRFHALPVGTDVNGCALLDADHRLFANVVADDRPASAWPGTGGLSKGCVPPTAGPYEKGERLTAAERARGARPAAICPQSDLRNIYYGLLGPRAKSITYVLGGKRHTLDTVGIEGAYMFVTRASAHQLLNFANAGTADVVPVDGPIREIHYRDGATCHLTRKSWIGGAYACTPSLPEPYGYAPLGRAPTAAEARTPVHAWVRRARDRVGHGSSYALFVSFLVPLSISNARRLYTITWIEHGMFPGAAASTWVEDPVKAGDVVTKEISPIGRHLRPGPIHGYVVLHQALGAGGLEGPGSVALRVGSFAARVP